MTRVLNWIKKIDINGEIPQDSWIAKIKFRYLFGFWIMFTLLIIVFQTSQQAKEERQFPKQMAAEIMIEYVLKTYRVDSFPKVSCLNLNIDGSRTCWAAFDRQLKTRTDKISVMRDVYAEEY
jgi:hypothetical protein